MNPTLTVFYIVFLSIILIAQGHKSSMHRAKISKNVSIKTPIYRRLEERQKLPLFPKNTIKFVVTPQPFAPKNDEPRANLQTKKPQTTKHDDKIDKRSVTRRPLMKAIDIIIESAKNKNSANDNNQHVERKREISYMDLHNTLEEANSEESSEIYEEFIFPLSLFEPIMENRAEQETQISEKNKVLDSSYPFEKAYKGNEFTFVKNEEHEHKERDNQINAPAYLSREYETTTELFKSKSALRRKRQNIIEEENKATTKSGFIYTGRDSKSTNDLLFKNINE